MIVKFECSNTPCRAVNRVEIHTEEERAAVRATAAVPPGVSRNVLQVGFEGVDLGVFGTRTFSIGEDTFTWCRVCGVVQKLSVVAAGDDTTGQPNTTPHAQHQCPACAAKRMHTSEERETFHPLQGKDIDEFNWPTKRRKQDAGGDVPISDKRGEGSGGDV